MGESARLVVYRGAGAHKKRPRCSLSKVQRALPRDEIERGGRPGPAVGRVLDENLRKGKGQGGPLGKSQRGLAGPPT